MLIQKGNVLLFEENGFAVRDIRVEEGKIVEIAPSIPPGEGETCYDASGKYVTPGLIDAHTFSALFKFPIQNRAPFKAPMDVPATASILVSIPASRRARHTPIW